MGARTVAVFPYEDRWSEHRLKADEAYEIGERGHPVRAYLDPDAIVEAAVKAGADAVYPGYGFLSENPHLAEACANAGITFVGPTAEVLTLTGNKARAIAAAKAAGVPTLESVPPNDDLDALMEAADGAALPAVREGGRRRWRPRHAEGRRGEGPRGRDRHLHARGARARSATRPSSSSRPWSTRGTSRCRSSPTAQGNVIHLFERDCSVQRRHQKVVEIAPAPNLDPELRERMCADAVRFAHRDRLPQRRHGRVPARPGRQLRLHRDEPADPGRAHRDRGGHRRRPGAVPAADRLRRDPRRTSGCSQDSIRLRGAALQCRITTEDPANGFRPDTGRITTYRSPGGGGVRLDGGTTYTGAEVSAHFDSMLAKLTCRGRTFENAVQKARRAVAEFRIRGVATNIPFLHAVLDEPDFVRRQRHHRLHRGPTRSCSRRAAAATAAPSCSPGSPR